MKFVQNPRWLLVVTYIDDITRQPMHSIDYHSTKRKAFYAAKKSYEESHDNRVVSVFDTKENWLKPVKEYRR